MHFDDTGEFGNKAPLPIDTATYERGSFAQLGEGQGAVMGSRGGKRSAGHQPMDKRIVALIVVGALVAIALMGYLAVGVFSAARTAQNVSDTVEKMAVGFNESISYRGSSYELVKGDKGYQLVEKSESGDGEQVVLGELDGTPVCLVLYDGTLIVPENLKDGTWDVMAYTIGSGWSNLMGQDGEPCGGTGAITEGQLESTSLRLVIDGEPVSIPLVW